MSQRAFTAYGQPLALDPRAFGMMIAIPPTERKHRLVGQVAVVDVRGPLMSHADPCADSYDAIRARVAASLADHPRAVVLSIDSPGGLVGGMLDCARDVRSMCDAARVPLIAYVDGCAASAAYALACAASRIIVSPTGIVGSIGCIDALIDETARDAALGIRYSLIASGARKTDTNPHAATSEAAIFAAQELVNGLAGEFFQHVSAHRGIAVDRLIALEAGLVHGYRAVELHLADAVSTFDQVLASAGAGADVAATSAQTTPATGDDMNEKEEAFRAYLQGIADDEKSDEKAKAWAKARLSALTAAATPPTGEEKTEEAPPAEPKKEEEEEEAKAAASATAIASKALAIAERGERARILGSRPDLTADQHKALASVSLDSLETVLRAIPRASAKPAATAVVASIRGEGQGGDGARMTLEQANAALGFKADPSGIVREGLAVNYHAMTTAEARAHLASKTGGAQ